MESAKKRTAEAKEKNTPTTSNLASLLIGLKESDDVNLGELNNSEPRLELVKDNCNCKKSRCLKLYVCDTCYVFLSCHRQMALKDILTSHLINLILIYRLSMMKYSFSSRVFFSFLSIQFISDSLFLCLLIDTLLDYK